MATMTILGRVFMLGAALFVTSTVAVQADAPSEGTLRAEPPKCAADTGIGGVVLELYRLAAGGESGDLYDEVRAKVGIHSVIPDSMVVLETDESQCWSAAAVYDQQFGMDSLDRVVVVRVDSMRAIYRDEYRPPGTPMTTGVVAHLITNAAFVVRDTLWY